MATRRIRISDISGEEIPAGKGALVRITYFDARRASKLLDVSDDEAEEIGQHGRTVARRGRPPKTLQAIEAA